MSEENKDFTRRKVTSFGNSWIVCKSKSHPGHVYYFNSLTGETAWNLSDAEIEKAKNRTKHLERLPGAKPTKCPEPRDKPPSTALNNPEKPSHEQFIINSISEQQSSVLSYSNIANSNAAFCAPFNQISGIMPGTQINNPSSVEPLCNFNSLSTYHLNTIPTVYNPNVWAIPHTQQVFVAPAIAPVVNHNPVPLNVAFNQLSQTVAQPAKEHVFNNLDNASQSALITSGTQTFIPREFNRDQGVYKKNGYLNKNDLRQKLSFKKRFNNSNIPGGSGLLKFNSRKADIATHIANHGKGIHSNELNSGMERRENRCETQMHETTSKINLEPLKSLAPYNSNSDAWFIVMDLEILLNEFKFLTTLTDSDEKCHLMVPQRVMEELKSYVICTENIQAKRILRFLSQQIEIGYAYIAEEPSKEEDDSMAWVIYLTCKELIDKNYHVILLTNDKEILTKVSSNIHMFCIDEIKNFLMESPTQQLIPSGPKKPFMTNELINKIKITVPNNASQNTDTTNPVKDTQSDRHCDNISVTSSKQNNTSDKTEELIPLKHTVDAGIQTDLEDIIANISLTNLLEEQRINTDPIFFPINTVPITPSINTNPITPINTSPRTPINTAPKTPPINRAPITPPINTDPITPPINTAPITPPINTDPIIPPINTKEAITKRLNPVSNIPDKKREIKLKRSTSHQTPVNSFDSEKKQFKWRRRRNTSHNEVNMNAKNVESLHTSTFNNDISMPDGKFNNNPIIRSVEKKNPDDSLESRESSIYAEPGNSTNKENITIEETSTSGIISNTESNVDAESLYSNSNNSTFHQPVYNGQQIFDPQQSKPMYEVDSISMEQYLRMKCDEWISRFIQIMEEVLTQVLQQDPVFTHHAMPPPWTLHEAVQCIVMKFSGHQGIRAAAIKLSNILFQVSDAKGKITMNMTPYQYMQMYSYGVHLLAAIREVTASCEDIQIAVESLNKLLHDIRNPNMESNISDVFIENIHDNMSTNDVSNCSDVPVNSDCSLHQQEVLPDSNHNEEVCKDKLAHEKLQKPVTFIRNFDIPFSYLKSLGNQRSKIGNRIKSQVQALEGNNQQNDNKTTEKETDNDVSTHQPNIIRKFSKLAELERKLKINNILNVYEDQDDSLDYNESYDEYAEDYCSDEEQFHDANSNQSNEEEDTNEVCQIKSLNDVDSLLSSENSKKIKYMMGMFLQEIRNALSQVKTLCDQCYKELKNPEQTTEMKSQLRKRVERAHLHTIRLCKSLESMLDHEAQDPTRSISDLLKQADINTHHVDAGLLMEYRITVAKCKDHADEFLSSIKNIISDIRR